MVAQTRGGTEKSPSKIRFKEKLVGKGLSNDALQKRLKVRFLFSSSNGF